MKPELSPLIPAIEKVPTTSPASPRKAMPASISRILLAV